MNLPYTLKVMGSSPIYMYICFFFLTIILCYQIWQRNSPSSQFLLRSSSRIFSSVVIWWCVFAGSYRLLFCFYRSGLRFKLLTRTCLFLPGVCPIAFPNISGVCSASEGGDGCIQPLGDCCDYEGEHNHKDWRLVLICL